MSKVAIVCVDDEDNILNCLKMQLERYYGESFILEYSQSGEEALEVVEQLKSKGIENIIVICDLNLGDSSGDYVLSCIHKKYPEVVKMLLSGFIPPEIISDLENTINLKGYIYKPWDSQKLIETIDSAISETSEFSNDISATDKKINKTAAICIISDNAIQQKMEHKLRQINCGMYEVVCVNNTEDANVAAISLSNQGVRHLVVAADWGKRESDLVIEAVSKFVSVKVVVLNGQSDLVLMNGMIKGIELSETLNGINSIDTTCQTIDSVAKKCYSITCGQN